MREIQQRTTAKIAISIPILTENPSHAAFKRNVEISNTIRDVAKQFSVAYIPFNEEMVKFVEKNRSDSKLSFEKRLQWMVMAIFKHYILRKSWDRISSDSDFKTMIDNVHLNTLGARIAANLVADIIIQ